MKKGFYPKLAWDGIRKNKRLYTPYILTSIGMVMMYYIVRFLTDSTVIQQMPGSVTIRNIMETGSWVIAFFAMLFLFYSNSFLIRRRKKEFGMYNILGMGKWNIGKIMFWESVIITAISLGAGLFLGISFSKLFELAMANLMSGEIHYDFTVSLSGIVMTLLIFGGVFVLILVNGLRQISFSNPVALLRGENVGEKPPKAKWLMSIAGVLILAAAYYLAVKLEDPTTILVLFFVAVLMVIVATYLLFISGSVTLCRVLQKNKKYYYKANHFISVSSMTYRMNRNGAGLASICILLTMVLVMLSATTALYVGEEDSLRSRYPKDINVNLHMEQLADVQEENVCHIRDEIGKVLDAYQVAPQAEYDYRTVTTSGVLNGNTLDTRESAFATLNTLNMEQKSIPVLAYFVSLDDYNRLMGETKTLGENEVLVYPFRTEYTAPTFQINDSNAYQVKEVVDDFVSNGTSAMTAFPTIFVFVPDLASFTAPLQQRADFAGDSVLDYEWYYNFNVDLPQQEQIAVAEEIHHTFAEQKISVESLEANRLDFYSLFGGLFFIGIMLSIVFLTAAVLIIYYKQISEGYEDQARFEIMQKVGMTKREIRKSINSQMLTVFCLPLLTAGVHLCFAFPMIHKMLRMFNLWNTTLLIETTAVCFVLFGLLYTLVYRLTSNAYFNIVSGAKEG